MVEQFAWEFRQLYPRAELLAASSANLVKTSGGRSWPA